MEFNGEREVVRRDQTMMCHGIAAGRAGSTRIFMGIIFLVLIMPVFAQEPLSMTVTDSVAETPCVLPQLASLEIGFTLTHETVDTEAEDACTAKQGGGASVDGVNNIVTGTTMTQR